MHPLAKNLPQRLIEAAPDAIIFADRGGVIRLWNHGAEALFGYTAAEALGDTLDLIVPEPFRAAHWTGFHRAIESGHFAKDTSFLTSRALTKNGKTIYVELSAAITCDDTEQPIGVMSIGRDVTKRQGIRLKLDILSPQSLSARAYWRCRGQGNASICPPIFPNRPFRGPHRGEPLSPQRNPSAF